MKEECEIKDGKIEFCTSLLDKLAMSPNVHNKGLVQINLYDRKTGNNDRCIGVAYKKGANDRGSMLNYCPWCGKKILNVESKK